MIRSVRSLANPFGIYKAYHRFVHVEKRSGYVRLFKENDTMDFHYVWLRHNCPDIGKSVHPKTGERIIDCAEIPLDIQPEQVQLIDNEQKLQIVWSKDHTSLYDLSFLLANNYGKNRKEFAKPLAKINDVEIIYDKTQENAAYLKKCHDVLKKFGLIVVRQRGLDTEAIMYEKIISVSFYIRDNNELIRLERTFFHVVHRLLRRTLVELKIYVRIIQPIKIMIN